MQHQKPTAIAYFKTLSMRAVCGMLLFLSACIVEPAPPEAAAYPCCYAYYDYPRYYGHPYVGGGYGWGEHRWR